jgi:phosphoribosylamine--glycine ligase
VRVLVVGGGAREHALVWKLQFSPEVSAVYAAPGNAGISFLARVSPIAAEDVSGLLKLAQQHRIDLAVVGPEAPLALGIVDLFQGAGFRIFGPTRAAARLETSKIWAKELMQRHDIPTARWVAPTDPEAARAAVRQFGAPVVLKADGLAGGKGAVVCDSLEGAETVIEDFMVRGALGGAGERLVIEEYLEGVELSVFALADGQHVLPLTMARDYKPLLDGDQGPNTGGMGGYARPSYATPALMEEVQRRILEPTILAMGVEGEPYVGVLYAGLMLTPEGPKVLEFNCRWGDPEAELLLPLLKTDLVDLMEACIDGRLHETAVEWAEERTCGVVLASRGYPATPERGVKISGLDDLDQGVLAFHGGTRLLKSPPARTGWLRRGPPPTSEADVGLVTDGGRVLTIVARGSTLSEARAKVYANIARVHFPGMQYRQDIGLDEEMVERRTGIAPNGVAPPGVEVEPVSPPLPLGEAGRSPRERARTGEGARRRARAQSRANTRPNRPGVVARKEDALTPTLSQRERGSSLTPDLLARKDDALTPTLFQRERGSSLTPPAPAPTSVLQAPQSSALSPQPSALVAVVMGSESDRLVMDETAGTLEALGISHSVQVMSAHRTPESVRRFARSAEARGVRVVIAGAGAAAHLPGAIAAQTTLPVIGVPLAGTGLLGLDALLSIVQMPGGVPVATVAVGAAGARNAAYLAAAILSLADEEIRERYRRFRIDQSEGELGSDD